MEITAEKVVTAIISALIVGYVQPYLPTIKNSGVLLNTLTDPLTQSLLIFTALFIVLTTAADSLRHHLNGPDVNRRSPYISSSRPDIVFWTGTLQRFGVIWHTVYGTNRRSRSPAYAYVEGPICPECGNDLFGDEEARWLRSDRKIWICSGCEFQRTRTEFSGRESSIVKGIAENVATGAIAAHRTLDQNRQLVKVCEDIIEDAFDEEIGVRELFENPALLDTSEARTAVEEAVEEHVSEEMLEDDRVQSVLLGVFHYNTSNTQYEVLQQTLNETKLHKIDWEKIPS